MISVAARNALARAALIVCALAPVSVLGADGPGAERLRLELRGQVIPRCSFSGVPSSIDLGKIGGGDKPAQREFTFQLDCNAPFAYGMSSDSGSMRMNGARSANRTVGEIPYRASLIILTDSGGRLSLDCESRQMMGEAGSCQARSGDQTAIGRNGVLRVSWDAPRGRLREGRYTADLRIDVAIAN